jgi:hypothetical protein
MDTRCTGEAKSGDALLPRAAPHTTNYGTCFFITFVCLCSGAVTLVVTKCYY